MPSRPDAAARHLKDLARTRYAYKFEPDRGARVCRFIENLSHTKGRWAARKEHVRLKPWQCFLVVVLFGWVHKRTGKRRFRSAYWEIPRKNGKSLLAAAIGLYMLLADGEFGAEVYSGATTESQAWEVFRPARLMLNGNEELREKLHATVHAKALTVETNGSRFQPIIGDPGDGSSPSCAIVDEYHEHQTSSLHDTMETGMLAREQPLMLIITTAGYNIAGPCHAKHDQVVKMLNGTVPDEETFGVIFGIDEQEYNRSGTTAEAVARMNEVCDCAAPRCEATTLRVAREAWAGHRKSAEGKPGCEALRVVRPVESGWVLVEPPDEWSSPKALQKANPNFGVSADAEILKALQRKAMQNPTEQNKFKTKHLNVWTSVLAGIMNMQDWERCRDPMLDEEELAGADCIVSTDLASKLDLCTEQRLYYKMFGGLRHYYLFGSYWLPEAAIEEEGPNQAIYRAWVISGLLTQTDGATVDFEQITDEVIADCKRINPHEAVFDPFNAVQMMQALQKKKITCVEFVQNAQNFAVPLDELLAAVKDGRFHHDGNEITTWCMSNVVARPTRKGLISPIKQKPHQKIDGAIAAIMALSRAMAPRAPVKTYRMFVPT